MIPLEQQDAAVGPGDKICPTSDSPSPSKRLESELLVEKTFSEAAINSLPGVFYLFDVNGTFLRWNRNFEEVSGYSSQEIARMNPLDFFRGQEKQAIAEAISHVFREGYVSIEANFVTKNGRAIPHFFVGRRIHVDGAAYVVGEGVDLTDRLDAQQAQRATLNILEDFGEEKSKLALLQQATMNLLEDFDEERQKLQTIQKATLNLLEDMHDERFKLSDTQQALMNMLEDVEGERVKAEQAKSLTETVNNELEAFSYSVSHDLRAPLRAISGFAEAVMEDFAPRLGAEAQRYLGLIQDNAHKMGQLIDDLLSFSRLGRQQMTETRIDMAALAKSVFDELAVQASQRDIALTIGSVPPARGDAALVRQVLANLLSNAIKFTRTRDHAVIEFGYKLQPDGGAYFVKDNGVGFDMQYVGKLFGVFQRLHSVAEFEGTGVGLALAQRIIMRHGGRVRAEGTVDKGATFYFTLPKGEAR